MWYSSCKNELDYSKPIVAERKTDGSIYLLLPQIDTQVHKSVLVKSYNWFDLIKGVYNSCTCWDNPRKAVDSYSASFLIYNVDIGLNKL